MAPLILHNVPENERYVGKDGVKRPYAMLFPQQDGPSVGRRKGFAESGSFGKSTRRSRSRNGTPARREDPTIAAADKVFNNFFAKRNSQEKKANRSSLQNLEDNLPLMHPRYARIQEPTEVVLRGYRSSQQQYAAINHFEQLAGRICEDYARDPPMENRRYKSELRDPALTRRQKLTAEESVKVNNACSGKHWVKVTFESADAAETAISVSPQPVLGYLVYAEEYRGVAPMRDEAVADPALSDRDYAARGLGRRQGSRPGIKQLADYGRRMNEAETRAFTTPRFPSLKPQKDDVNMEAFRRAMMNSSRLDLSPPHSQISSHTLDTTTLTAATNDTNTLSSATVTGVTSTHTEMVPAGQESEFCRRAPSVRKVRLLPAEQALRPAPNYQQRMINRIPFLRWFSGSMIGNEVPRTETGDFNWNSASLYWKLVWYLDYFLNVFQGEIWKAEKDD